MKISFEIIKSEWGNVPTLGKVFLISFFAVCVFFIFKSCFYGF